MKYLFSIAAAGMLVVAFNSSASAQSIFAGGTNYGFPYYAPSNYYVQPQFGAFRNPAPSIGFGININPAFGSSFGIYSQPNHYGSWNNPRFQQNRFGHPHHHHHHHYNRGPHGYGPVPGYRFR